MPKEKRKTIVKKYVKGVVVVQVVNHSVTRVPDEKVEDMPGIDDMELADGISVPVEDGEDMSIFMMVCSRLLS
jgi:hypothetical protein